MISSRTLFALGIALLVAFTTLFVVLLWLAEDADEVHWSRLIYLFGSAEAIVFSVVGWLFGSEVHRGRASAAEASAQAANEALSASRLEATKFEERGSALAAAVRTVQGAQDPSAEGGGLLAGAAPAPVATSLWSLRLLADNLFPPPPAAQDEPK